MESALVSLNYPTGIIHQEARPEYSRAYRSATADQLGQPVVEVQTITPKYRNRVTSELRCVIAGAAGKKIGSAATAFSRGAMLSGLWASQRHEYPVTVKSGYSVSDVILSPEKVLYTGISKPDLMIVLSPEGLAKARAYVGKLSADDTLYINASLLPVETQARQVLLDFDKAGIWARRKEYWAAMALAEVLRHRQFYPIEAFEEAILCQRSYAQENLAAVEASKALRVLN